MSQVHPSASPIGASPIGDGIQIGDAIDRVRETVLPILATHGLELVEIEWKGGPNGRILRISIERSTEADGVDADADGIDAGAFVEAGVNLDDCAMVSREISEAVDFDGLMAERFDLEVSSPGVERPLFGLKDYRRFSGKLAKVTLKRPDANGHRVLRGIISAGSDAASAAAAGDEASLSIDIDADGTVHRVRFDDIEAAHLLFEMAVGVKKAKPAKGARRPTTRPTTSAR